MTTVHYYPGCVYFRALDDSGCAQMFHEVCLLSSVRWWQLYTIFLHGVFTFQHLMMVAVCSLCVQVYEPIKELK